MEAMLNKAVDEISSTTNVTGCLFADKQGLYLEGRNINPKSVGVAVAISEQACKLEPNANPPIVTLESGDKTCIIHKYGNVTGVIYKQNKNQR